MEPIPQVDIKRSQQRWVGLIFFFFFELISQVKCILFVVLLWQGLVELK